MWNHMAMAGFQSAISRGLSFFQAQKEAKIKRQWQEYQNKMVRMADAQNQNAITTNQIMAREGQARQSFDIKRQAYKTSASAKVAAAAEGTAGNSVSAVLLDIDRSRAEAESISKRDLRNKDIQALGQRRNSAFSAQQNLDFSPIPNPNPLTYALGFVTDMAGAYDKHKKQQLGI